MERAPEHIHTYRITRLGLWNARAAGHDSDFVLAILDRYAKFPVPAAVRTDIAETMARYGRLTIQRSSDGDLELHSESVAVLREAAHNRKIVELLDGPVDSNTFRIRPWARGQVKQELLKLGWPAEDFAGYTPGTPHPIALDETGWDMRGYQRQAVDKFWEGGSGVVVLPCGAGKTIVGAGAMSVAQTSTLILVTNTVSARQWKAELIRRTTGATAHGFATPLVTKADGTGLGYVTPPLDADTVVVGAGSVDLWVKASRSGIAIRPVPTENATLRSIAAVAGVTNMPFGSTTLMLSADNSKAVLNFAFSGTSSTVTGFRSRACGLTRPTPIS